MAQATIYTLADLDARVLDRLDNNSIFYPTSERYSAINEAIKVLNIYTGFLQTTVSISGGTQSGKLFYNVPSSVLFAEAVIFNNRPLRRSSIGSLGRRYRDWTSHTTVNFGAVADWAPVGLRKIAIHPADNTGGVSLQISGVQEPVKLALVGDSVQIPDEFIEIMEEYASFTLQLKEGGKIFSDASLLYQRFLHRMKELGRWTGLRQPRYFVETTSVKEGG